MADEIPEIHPRVDFWLNLWARSCRPKASDLARLGFPDHSQPFIGGGESQRAEDWDDDEWRKTVARNCKAMDALIADLPPAQCAAVRNVYAGENFFRYPRNNLCALLESASNILLVGMNARAVI